MLSACGVFNSLTSRKNVGRTVLLLLLIMVVVSAFLKFSFPVGGGGVDDGWKIVRMSEKESLLIQNFKKDLLSKAQMAVFDSDGSAGAAVQQRQMKEFPVSIKKETFFKKGNSYVISFGLTFR